MSLSQNRCRLHAADRRRPHSPLTAPVISLSPAFTIQSGPAPGGKPGPIPGERKRELRDNPMLNLPMRFALLLMLPVIAASCATTRTTAEWSDAAHRGKFGNVLVVGISQKATLRRLFEDKLLERLARRNVRGQAGYTLLPDGQKVSKESIRQAIEGRGFDGVLIAHRVGAETREVYVPPTYTVVSRPHFRSYYDYYSHVFDYVYEPGYTERYQVYKIESTLYNTSTEQPVWSMQTETVEPDMPTDVIDALIDKIIASLSARGLI